LKKDCVDW